MTLLQASIMLQVLPCVCSGVTTHGMVCSGVLFWWPANNLSDFVPLYHNATTRKPEHGKFDTLHFRDFASRHHVSCTHSLTCPSARFPLCLSCSRRRSSEPVYSRRDCVAGRGRRWWLRWAALRVSLVSFTANEKRGERRVYRVPTIAHDFASGVDHASSVAGCV